MTYIVKGEVTAATFIHRPNRFIAIVECEGKQIRCHLPNPGRMTELLIPNQSQVYIRINQPSKYHRKTQASLVAVKVVDEIIQLDSNLVAKWLPEEFRGNTVPGLENWKIVKKEAKMGKHRFDFILQNPDGNNVITEVKSTTKVINKIACFPDAVSKRATSQALSLIDLSREGKECLILFIVQRNANSFTPCDKIDPKYAASFWKLLLSGVKVKIILANAKIVCSNNSKVIQVSLLRELPLKKKSL